MSRYIRRAFWGIVASSVLLMFTGYSKVPERLLSSFQMVNELQKMKTQKPGLQQKVKSDLKSQSQIQSSNMQNGLSEKSESIQYEEKHETLNDKKYVFINGKYYEYREDHIYMVDGVRTYFVDNRKVEDSSARPSVANAAGALAKSGLDQASDALSTAQKKLGQVSEDILDPKQALQKLKDLQEMNKQRDQYLDSLSSGGQ